MFTRYWRTYPWFLQLFLFAMMIVTFLGLGSALLFTLAKISGYTLQDITSITGNSPVRLLRTAILIQGIAHLMTFAVPCFLFAYLTHPKPGKYLGLQAPQNKLHWLLVPVIMIGLMMVILYADTFISTHIKLSDSLQKQQDHANEQMKGLLSLKTGGDFLVMIIVMAVLPAFGEEFMFRGLFMRFARKRSRNMVFPVLISGVLFMLVHDNPLGMPFILIAGVVLALIYWLTGSLWLSIFGHFLFNGLQVALAYISNHQPATVSPANDDLPLWLPFAGLALFLAAGYALIKTKRPLPPDWSDDFRGEKRDDTPPASPFSLS